MPIPEQDKDITAIIDIHAIKHNIHYLQQKTQTPIMPVIKANAYGHGIIEIANILRKLDVQYLGVATLGEAIQLRNSGDVGRILAWMYNIRGPEMVDAVQMEIDIAIFDESFVPILSKIAEKTGKKIKATIYVDTGMNRAGVPYERAINVCRHVHSAKHFEFVGLMSHLVCSDTPNCKFVHQQLSSFRKLRAQLESIGIFPPLVHIANTGACLHYDVSDFTISRPGCGVFGINTVNRMYRPLKIAMTVVSRIVQIKSIEKGAGIGYHSEYIAPRNMQICIVPIGYADIIPWNLAGPLHVYINGTKRNVLGQINMDQIVVQSRPNDRMNMHVFLFGNGTNCPQTIYHISKLSGNKATEILSRLGNRVYRKYIK